MSETQEEQALRPPPRVEVVIVDEAAAKGSSLGAALKGALAAGLMGAGLFGVVGAVLGRELVAWSETPKVLASCKEPVEIGVQSALDNLLIAQGGAVGTGFVLLFMWGFTRRRRKAKAAGAGPHLEGGP